jgi:hypothetical protein
MPPRYIEARSECEVTVTYLNEVVDSYLYGDFGTGAGCRRVTTTATTTLTTTATTTATTFTPTGAPTVQPTVLFALASSIVRAALLVCFSTTTRPFITVHTHTRARAHAHTHTHTQRTHSHTHTHTHTHSHTHTHTHTHTCKVLLATCARTHAIPITPPTSRRSLLWRRRMGKIAPTSRSS